MRFVNIYSYTHLLSLCLLLFSTGCLDTRPKVFTSNKSGFNQDDTGTQNSFKFNFAFRDTTDVTAPYTIYLQGSANTKSGMIGTCNLAGTGCVCDFLDASENIIEQTASTKISYDSTGNYYRCVFSGTGALAKVRIHSISNSVTSPVIDVETSLTVQKIIGTELDINRVRTVYNYSCQYDFLQKAGTTIASFDCSNQAAACNGDNFCLLRSRFPFYLYSDNYTSNFSQKIADRLYNGGGTDKICGIQIKQIDCADAQGTPVKSFGLFGEQTGIWETSLQLGAGPDLATASYGYAAKVSTTTNECPPGLEKRVFYRVAVSNAAATESNYPSGLSAAQVKRSGDAPSNFQIDQIPGGHCNGTSCTLPAAGVLTVSNQVYSSVGETEFCVIPSTLLP